MIILDAETIRETFRSLHQALAVMEHIDDLGCEDDIILAAAFDMADELFHKVMRVLAIIASNASIRRSSKSMCSGTIC